MPRLWDLTDRPSCYEFFVNQPSDFQHCFGGKPSYSGIIPERGNQAIHLLFTFDLGDPRVPFRQPSVSRLPLFYPFQYDGSSMWYRVCNDESIEITRQPERDFSDDFPFDGYPESFEQMPVSISSRIGIDSYFEDDFLRQCWEEDLETASKMGEKLDDLDRISVVEGLMQGTPRSICIDPKCQNQKMLLLTVLRGNLIDGMHLWSDEEIGPEVDITYEYCPTCFVIYTENQCD